MLTIPIESADHKSDMLIVVLDSDNLIRMGKADPAEVKCRELGKRLVNPSVLICHEPATKALMDVVATRDLKKIVKYLQRGWEFRPDLGDNDKPPEVLVKGIPT